ncbi:MAG: hypothetical protein AAGJ08_26940 [Cyanobacteria bacterium P01_H01_bin.35]
MGICPHHNLEFAGLQLVALRIPHSLSLILNCDDDCPDQAISKRGLKKGFLEPSGTQISIPTKILRTVNEIRLVPDNGYYIFEVVYELELGKLLNSNQVAAIGLGLSFFSNSLLKFKGI